MIQLIEKGLIDDSGQRSPNPAGFHALLNNDALARLLHAFCDGFQIKRFQTDEINDLKAQVR